MATLQGNKCSKIKGRPVCQKVSGLLPSHQITTHNLQGLSFPGLYFPVGTCEEQWHIYNSITWGSFSLKVLIPNDFGTLCGVN